MSNKYTQLCALPTVFWVVPPPPNLGIPSFQSLACPNVSDQMYGISSYPAAMCLSLPSSSEQTHLGWEASTFYPFPWNLLCTFRSRGINGKLILILMKPGWKISQDISVLTVLPLWGSSNITGHLLFMALYTSWLYGLNIFFIFICKHYT